MLAYAVKQNKNREKKTKRAQDSNSFVQNKKYLFFLSFLETKYAEVIHIPTKCGSVGVSFLLLLFRVQFYYIFFLYASPTIALYINHRRRNRRHSAIAHNGRMLYAFSLIFQAKISLICTVTSFDVQRALVHSVCKCASRVCGNKNRFQRKKRFHSIEMKIIKNE